MLHDLEPVNTLSKFRFPIKESRVLAAMETKKPRRVL